MINDDKCGSFYQALKICVSTNCNIFFLKKTNKNVLFVTSQRNMLDNEIPRLDGQATEQKNCISPVVAPAVQEPRKRGRKRQHVARQAICYMGAFKKT